MYRALLLATSLLTSAPVAVAQPASYDAPRREAPLAPAASDVSVAIGPELADKARRILIGERDLTELRRDLQTTVARALAKGGPNAPVRVELILRDATNNRPTFDQLSRETSLSLRSIGLGGATIGGQAVFADGRTVPVDYAYYETDLRNDYGFATWTDADRAFDFLAGRLGRGDLRPSRLGSADPDGGNFGRRFAR